MEREWTHFDKDGNAVMVDVSGKQETNRTAVAVGTIRVGAQVMDAVMKRTVKKGDVLTVAQVAGIMAVKKTWELIPMCHPLMIQKCSVEFFPNVERGEIQAVCTVKTAGQTGVEMEALTGVHVALLTIYDMCKAIDKGMVMTEIHLLEKTGGKSGDFHFSGEHEKE
ncbi:MAG: cyclic pyranopterin monophosphate synthase MoaC [bacterium]|nr:cyclic pyranopterin monophosphate synthase MoaC [bacterium]